MVKLVARLTPGASPGNLGVDLVDGVNRERESRGSLDPRLSRRSETGCGDLARASILGDEKTRGKRRCWWRDSNPQGLSPRDVRGLSAYQFRHQHRRLPRVFSSPSIEARARSP